VPQRLIYISVWKLGLTALVTATSNFKAKGSHLKWSKHSTPPPFLGHRPVFAATQQIHSTFSVREVVPSPVAGETAIIETKRGGWVSLFRQHLACSPKSTAGFLSVHFFKHSSLYF